ncbi:sensor histidine kinase [Agathobaculum sp.]|uniref:sensor histidine kinase n=1 Tax=Agathobaculum sp. TaxID=2048138 RepID=UPI0027BAEB89|nr:HAMP domain-containing sensor histidine kinase [Agathobaculum sp.]
MKTKRRNYWSFFWRVGAGFLAFWLAVMGLFTYLSASKKLTDAQDGSKIQSELRLHVMTAMQYDQDESWPADWYEICNTLSNDPLAVVGIFDEDGSLLASSGNYLYGLSTYIDLSRWLTDEEQCRLVELAQECSTSIESGSIQYILHVNGWQDGEMLIPYKITYTTEEYMVLEDGSITSTENQQETTLMQRQPDIDTSDLWWIPFTIDIPLGVNGSSFTLPGFDIESGTEGYIQTRDSGEWIQMYDRMLRLAEGRDNKTFSLGAYGDDNTIFHYYLECGWYLSDDFYGYPEDGKFLIFIWSYYPLREAMQELTPTYAATGMLMLLMSAILAFALLRVWRKQERVEQARRDTTAALAHELKTPLSVLSATAELLSNDMAQDKRAHYLDVIRQQAARMDGSVGRMLELSRLEAGAKALRRAKFTLSDLAQERLDAAVQPDADLHTEVTVSGAEEIDADRTLLARALDAILENAVQHTAPGGSIAVRIEKGVCAVVNTGAAIPADALPRLWEAYYQADASRAAKGDGLGLSIAKTVFDLHGYAYGAENTDEGPRFWFRFG